MNKLGCQSGMTVNNKKQLDGVHCNKEGELKSNNEKSFSTSDAINDEPSRPLPKKTRLATLAQIGEDWLYLALLGTIMALLSFSMDSVITLFLKTRLWLFTDLNEDDLFVQYLGWCIMPVVLIAFSTGFVHLCSPTVSMV